MQARFDHHVHIGRFNEVCYGYEYVFDSLKERMGIDECICSHLTPCFTNFGCCISFYDLMLRNVENAIRYAEGIGIKTHFYYWVDPCLLSGGLSMEEVLSTGIFEGLKVHPALNTYSEEQLNIVFSTAESRGLPVLLHTGLKACDDPMLFEEYFVRFPRVKVQLAHCKDPSSVVALFSRHSNLTGDIALCPEGSLKAICDAGFESRMVYGSDFPVCEYYRRRASSRNPGRDI